MSENKGRPRGLIQALAGIAGFGALAGVMVTAMISPALAVASVGTNSAVGVFNALPEFIELGEQAQKNTLWAQNSADPADGYTQIAEVYWQDREEIALEDMSPHLVAAAVAGEDRRFYDHVGVDVNSVVRAALGNVISGDIESGASTLTMQLVTEDSGGTVLEVGSNPYNFTANHDGSAKLATTATGIDVTGTVTADGLTVDGSSTFDDILLTAVALPSAGNPSIALRNTDNNIYIQTGSGNAITFLDSSQNTMLSATPTSHSLQISNGNAFAIDSNRDISFYSSDGLSQALFWDASASALGIGTTSPVGRLDVNGGILSVGVSTGDDVEAEKIRIGRSTSNVRYHYFTKMSRH